MAKMGESKAELEALNKRFEGKNVDKMAASNLLTNFNKLSGSRSHLFFTHVSKALMLVNPESPLVYTGYELAFGERSNGYKIADDDYRIIARVSRHTIMPNSKYVLILQRIKDGLFTILEITHYKSLTEIHGYIKPDSPLNNFKPGQIITKGQELYRAATTDSYNNYKYGINAKAAFVNTTHCIADAVFISDEFAKKAAFNLIEETEITINTNDILLNLHGHENFYKCLPYIGEDVTESGILCARRKIDFNIASSNLTTKSMMTLLESDETFRGKGKVIDIDISVNKPEELLNNKDPFRMQLRELYEDQLRYNKEIYDILHPIVTNRNNKCSEELRHLYNISRNYINNIYLETNSSIQYCTNSGKFDFINISIKVAYQKPLECSDKVSNRSAAKGVISAIIPKEEMFRDEDGNYADICFAGKGIVGRLNIAQVYEHELNFIANKVIKKMKNLSNITEKFDYLLDFIGDISQEQKEELSKFWKILNTKEKGEFIQEIEDNGQVHIYQPPFSGNATLDQIEHLYDKYNIKPGYARCKRRFKMNQVLHDKYIAQEDAAIEKLMYKYIRPMAEQDRKKMTITRKEREDKKRLITAPDGKTYIRGAKYTMEHRKHHEENSIFKKLLNGLQIVKEKIDELTTEEFNSTKSYVTIDKEKGEIIRDFRTVRPLIIAPIYVMVLKQTADSGFSARSLGTVSQLGMPVKAIKTNKGYPYNSSPIRLSFMSICNASSMVPMEIIHRFKAVGASNPALRDLMSELLLTKDPFKLHNINIPLEQTMDDIPARMLHSYLRGLGLEILDKGESDPYAKYDFHEFYDMNKFYKSKGKLSD